MERCIAWTSPANQMILGCLGEWNIDWRCCELLGKCSLLPCPIMPRISWLFLDPPFFGNVSRHAFFENSCFWLVIRTLLLRIQYSSPFVSQKLSAALLLRVALVGPLIPRIPMALRQAVGDRLQTSTGRCSAGLQLEPPLMFNQPLLPPCELGES